MDNTGIVPTSMQNKGVCWVVIDNLPMVEGGITNEPPWFGLDFKKIYPLIHRLESNPKRNQAIVFVMADKPYYMLFKNIEIKKDYGPISMIAPKWSTPYCSEMEQSNAQYNT